jgi:hypothetical protein
MVGSSEQFCTGRPNLTFENQDRRDAIEKRQSVSIQPSTGQLSSVPNRINLAPGEGKARALQDASLMRKPRTRARYPAQKPFLLRLSLPSAHHF